LDSVSSFDAHPTTSDQASNDDIDDAVAHSSNSMPAPHSQPQPGTSRYIWVFLN
jgi:hypothetical protein